MNAKWFLLISGVCFWSLGLLTVIKMHSSHNHSDEQQTQERSLNSTTMKKIHVRASRHEFVEFKD